MSFPTTVTGFYCETMTDNLQACKVVNDILDFAGEEDHRRVCNCGLTETGQQAVKNIADPKPAPHLCLHGDQFSGKQRGKHPALCCMKR